MKAREEPGREFVFAYGSLVRDLARDGSEGSVAADAADAEAQARALRAARLRDHRRVWNVAMDNALTLPGYKYYLDARDRSRPEVHVTFLNLLAAPGQSVNGMLVPVGGRELEELDRRERNYRRREVTDAIEILAAAGPGRAGAGGRVWAYYGRPEACRRFDEGQRAGRAVIDKAYLESVRAGFAALAAGALAEFERSTGEHRCRVLELVRVEID